MMNYTLKELKNNKEVVLTAIKDDKSALEFASNELKDDRKFILELVKQYGESILKYTPYELRNLKIDKY